LGINDVIILAEQNGIELIHLPHKPDIKFKFDLKRMQQVITNLLSNAIKYSPEGGKVTIKSELINNHVRLIIEDNGLGIPENDIPHLFDKFYRVYRENHSHIEGTGLGLSIVKAIVEEHRGQIEVESEVRKGSKFIITLPKN